jgi:hypothetical protein
MSGQYCLYSKSVGMLGGVPSSDDADRTTTAREHVPPRFAPLSKIAFLVIALSRYNTPTQRNAIVPVTSEEVSS